MTKDEDLSRLLHERFDAVLVEPVPARLQLRAPPWVGHARAAAILAAGIAIGLAMPLASLAAHAVSLWDLAIWVLVALAVQLALWFVLGLTLFRGLRESITQDRRSVGLVVGAFSASVGLLNAASLTY